MRLDSVGIKNVSYYIINIAIKDTDRERNNPQPFPEGIIITENFIVLNLASKIKVMSILIINRQSNGLLVSHLCSASLSTTR